MNRKRWGAMAAGLAAILTSPFSVDTVEASTVSVRVLSNRADLVSGGDALVEVLPSLPDGGAVTVDGRDVTSSFRVTATGRTIGLVTGLSVGDNVLKAAGPDGSGAKITIENHPVEGPVFSGPHLQPWQCTTNENGLGQPLDAHCNANAVVDYLYVPTSGGAYQAYDVKNPPTNVGTITNDRGDTVRNIVRRERGSINRGLYAIAYLHDPALGEPDPAAPQKGWNGKLYYPFGASCNTNHTQGSMPT